MDLITILEERERKDYYSQFKRTRAKERARERNNEGMKNFPIYKM